MRLSGDPREIATTLLRRSTCAVQVGAVIEDGWGVFGWGWNSSGRTGYGMHAEDHALARSNKGRLGGATLYVAARRRRNGKVVTARPCPDCQGLIQNWGIGRVWYRDGNGVWCCLF